VTDRHVDYDCSWTRWRSFLVFESLDSRGRQVKAGSGKSVCRKGSDDCLCHRFEALLEVLGELQLRKSQLSRRCFTLFPTCSPSPIVAPSMVPSHANFISPDFTTPSTSQRDNLSFFSTFGPRYSKLGRLIALSPESPTKTTTSNHVRQRA
jgi:hypothetical protein